MSNSNTCTHAAGIWLAVGGLLLAVVLILHGPLKPTISDQMHVIEHGPIWPIVHWAAAAALSLFAVAGPIVLTSGSRLTSSVATVTAWAVVSVGALWTMITAVADATAVTRSALSGNQEIFGAWWAFSEGMANGFAFLALAVAAIAANEARASERATPQWAAWLGAIVGLASFFGWALSSWLGFGQDGVRH